MLYKKGIVEKMNVGFISLGCSKNLVDTEMTIGLFKKNNYTIVNNPKDADIIVINTCGFIEAAKEEAIVLTSEAKSYSMKNGEEKWFKFQSGEQCRYFIEALELGEGLTLSVSSYGTVGNPYSSSSFKIGGFDSDNGYYYSYVGKTGGEVLWKVTARTEIL